MARIEVEPPKSTLPIKLEIPDIPPSYAEDPVTAKNWAKHTWLNKTGSYRDIANTVLVPYPTIAAWAISWRKELRELEGEQLRDVVRKCSERVETVFYKLMDVLEKSANNLIEQNVTLTVDQFNGFTGAAEKLHKMKQLEAGKPTEIYGKEDALSWDKIIVKLKEVDIVDYDGVNPASVKKITEVIPESKDL